MGNSDHSNPQPSSGKPATSLTAAAPLWRAYVRDITRARRTPTSRSRTAWSPRRSTPGRADGLAWTRDRVKDWFIDGTQPGDRPRDRSRRPALLASLRRLAGRPGEGRAGLVVMGRDVADWLARARRGVGVEGRHESRTAYFWGESSWGGTLMGPCCPSRSRNRRSRPRRRSRQAAEAAGRRRRARPRSDSGALIA